jgi:hypothetical protein
MSNISSLEHTYIDVLSEPQLSRFETYFRMSPEIMALSVESIEHHEVFHSKSRNRGLANSTCSSNPPLQAVSSALVLGVTTSYGRSWN